MNGNRRLTTCFILVTLAAATGCPFGSDDGPPGSSSILGSGTVVEENRPIAGVIRVVQAGIGTLHVEQGSVESLRVEAEDNLIGHIRTEVTFGTLQIVTEQGVNLQPTQDIHYYLTITSLESIVLSGVGDIEITDLSASEVSLTLSGVGSIRIFDLVATGLDITSSGVGGVTITGLDVDDLGIRMTGVGTATVSGVASRQEISISGIGDYNGGELATLETSVLIASDGSATVRVQDLLVVTFTGGGSVFYHGSPTVVGTGRIQQLSS